MPEMQTSATLDLVDRLGAALAGTYGRPVTTDALRSLVQMEVAEWRSEDLAKHLADQSNTVSSEAQIKG